MMPEIEKTLRFMSRALTKTVNNHLASKSNEISEDYFFYQLRTAYELGEKDLNIIVEKAALYDKLRNILRDLAQ
jgi:hypothetical protein